MVAFRALRGDYSRLNLSTAEVTGKIWMQFEATENVTNVVRPVCNSNTQSTA